MLGLSRLPALGASSSRGRTPRGRLLVVERWRGCGRREEPTPAGGVVRNYETTRTCRRRLYLASLRQRTLDYYRSIIAAFREQKPGGSYPAIIIDSIDLQRMLKLAATDLPQLAEYLAAELGRLARAGADFALLASNTPHIVFEDLERRSACSVHSSGCCTSLSVPRMSNQRRSRQFREASTGANHSRSCR